MLLIQLIRAVRRVRAKNTTGLVFLAVLLGLCILGNAATFYAYDRHLHEGLTFGDAVWYSVISITTIGYGDYSAQTTGARVGTIVFIVLLGLSSFTVLFGMLVDIAASFMLSGQKGLRKAMALDHVIIVNFPSANRVKQVIEEFTGDTGAASEIVIVSDTIDELPFAMPGVLFVRGSVHDEETYRRARVERARMAIVLSRDYADPSSDAINAAAAGVIDKAQPDIHIVAECVDIRHRKLFDAVRCDAIVAGLSIASNLLVQEVQDPGVSRLVEVLTSNRIGSTLFSTPVSGGSERAYPELVSGLLSRDVNVLAFSRAGEVHTRFVDETTREGDRLLYIADRRMTWADLTA